MSTYTDSHKRYYDNLKTNGIVSKLYRGDKEFIKMLNEAAERLKKEQKQSEKPLTAYIKNLE